jgi:N-acetylneuraminic acid mutarotase
MNSLAGKILRINSDGTIPSDNPFPGSPIYTLGHRNVFGIGFDPVTKVPYVTENGPTFCDEVNILIQGENYGWPYVLSGGCPYDPDFGFTFRSIEAYLLGRERYTEAFLSFSSTVAPTELIFYTGSRSPHELNNMFFLSFVNRELYRVEKPYPGQFSVSAYDIQFEGPRTEAGGIVNGFLDIEQGPDGFLYISSFDRIMRLDFSYSNITTTISLSARPDGAKESTKLTAKISDYFGNPVADIPIEFYDSGRLIGSSKSDPEGLAQIEYASGAEEQHAIIASFAGSDKYRSSSSAPATKEWSIAADMLTPRHEVKAATIGNRIYVVGGYATSSSVSTNILEIYDAETNTWSRGKELPMALDHVGVASYQGKLYVVGGFSKHVPDTPSNTIFIYDPITDEWTRWADMPTPRGALTVDFVNGILYAVGGLNHIPLRINEAYDPATNTWTVKAPMPTARDHLTSGVVDGKLYVIGGRTGSTLTNLDVNEEYDPINDKWTTRAPMPSDRGAIDAASLSDSIYVFCGETPTITFANNEQYIPSLDMWIVREDMPTARAGCAVAEVGGSIYVIGGNPDPAFSVFSPSAENEQFTPTSWKTLIENLNP